MPDYLIKPSQTGLSDLTGAVLALNVSVPGSVTGLANGTSYVAYQVTLSAATSEFTPGVVGDDPPEISNVQIGTITATTYSVFYTVNEAATIYVVATLDEDQPTAAEIQLGQNADGNPAAFSSTLVAAQAGTEAFSVSSAFPDTDYYIHAVAVDAGSNLSAIASTGVIQTLPALPGTFGETQYNVTDNGSGASLRLTIVTLPAPNDSGGITDIEYRIGSGSAVSTGLSAAGTFDINSGLTEDVAATISVRAVNAQGAGAWSTGQTVTPTTLSTITLGSATYTAGSGGTGPSLSVQDLAVMNTTGPYFLDVVTHSNGAAITQSEMTNGNGNVDEKDTLGPQANIEDLDGSLTLTATQSGGRMTIQYRDSDGTLSALTAVTPVDGINIDTTPPAAPTAASDTDGDAIILTFAEAIYGAQDVGDFAVSGVSAGTPTISSVTGFGTTTLTIAISGNLIASGDTVTLAYTNSDSDLRDQSGNPLADFTGLAVTNNVVAAPTATAWTDASFNPSASGGTSKDFGTLDVGDAAANRVVYAMISQVGGSIADPTGLTANAGGVTFTKVASSTQGNVNLSLWSASVATGTTIDLDGLTSAGFDDIGASVAVAYGKTEGTATTFAQASTGTATLDTDVGAGDDVLCAVLNENGASWDGNWTGATQTATDGVYDIRSNEWVSTALVTNASAATPRAISVTHASTSNVVGIALPLS